MSHLGVGGARGCTLAAVRASHKALVKDPSQGTHPCVFPYGLAVRIPGFHPGGPGSTPGMGIALLFISLLSSARAMCYHQRAGPFQRKQAFHYNSATSNALPLQPGSPWSGLHKSNLAARSLSPISALGLLWWGTHRRRRLPRPAGGDCPPPLPPPPRGESILASV